MKDYKVLPESVKLMIENEVSKDFYDIKPSILYSNVVHALKEQKVEKVSRSFDISLTLCEMIEKENEKYIYA